MVNIIKQNTWFDVIDVEVNLTILLDLSAFISIHIACICVYARVHTHTCIIAFQPGK